MFQTPKADSTIGLRKMDEVVSSPAIVDPLNISMGNWASHRDRVANCTGMAHAPKGWVTAQTVEEVADWVRWAAKEGLSLYPISLGNNWGYGSKSPLREGQVVLDLSSMDRILDFNPTTGVVTVEPGVSQGDLAKFLKAQGDNYLTPTSGAGPDASVLGNALERGFGLTPFADHFQAVTSVEAVLADGSVYHSSFAALGAPNLGRHFRWSVGPYMDGLFTQSNFGIVTRISLALFRRPESIEAFFFTMKDHRDFPHLAAIVRDILHDFGGLIGGINLMNHYRVISMGRRAPDPWFSQEQPVPEAFMDHWARKEGIGDWSGVGTLYGPRAVVAAAHREIGRRLRTVCNRTVFFNSRTVRWATRLMSVLPSFCRRGLVKQLEKIKSSLALFEGTPNHVAHPLTQWRVKPTEDLSLNPDHGLMGLLWYAPIVEFEEKRLKEAIAMIENVCREHRMDPLITMTAVTPRTVEITLPLLFDRSHPEAQKRALACYNALFAEGQGRGMLPYRVGIQGADRVVVPDDPFWKLQRRIKHALDPNGVIAPGRYSSDVNDRLSNSQPKGA